MTRRRRSRQSGSTIVEFAIIAPCLILMFFGTVGLGFMLGRTVQNVQVCRDIAHMYSDGVDFTQTANQNIIIQQLAQGTGITAAGGNGVVILSRISTVFQVDCDAGGHSADCNNKTYAVFTQRIVFGNSSLRASDFGTPTSTLMDAQGNISPSVYLTNSDPSVRTTGFTTQLTTAGGAQLQGDAAWVAEVFFTYPDIGFLGWSTAGGAYSRFIF